MVLTVRGRAAPLVSPPREETRDKAIYRGLGSIDFTLMVGFDPSDLHKFEAKVLLINAEEARPTRLSSASWSGDAAGSPRPLRPLKTSWL